jgi:aspartate kinase
MKKIRVLKFGGGIFTDQWAMPVISGVINYELGDGCKIIAVASAMGKATRGLLAKIPEQLIPNPNPRDKDLLLSCGENESVALLAMYLKSIKMKAKSLTGAQAGIITDDDFGKANIIDIDADKIYDVLKENDVAVVAGFQGITRDGDITTLGFNGSDTTAFYLAHKFKADSCTLYKDVNGVYDKDPKEYPDARLYKTLNFKDVLKGNAKGIIHENALKLCRDSDSFPDVVIRNINLSQRQYTTICRKRTEFYK